MRAIIDNEQVDKLDLMGDFASSNQLKRNAKEDKDYVIVD